MSRRHRIVAILAALAALQLAALLIYLAVQRGRQARARDAGAFEHTELAEPAPAIRATLPDGREAGVAWPAPRHRLIHFWATWCEPCRRELPALLAFARDTPRLELVAIAIDDDWRDIAAFFAEVGGDGRGGDGGAGRGAIAPEVRLSTDAPAYKRFGVSTLPDSYLVAPSGQLLERYHGARDWHSAAARAHVRAAIE